MARSEAKIRVSLVTSTTINLRPLKWLGRGPRYGSADVGLRSPTGMNDSPSMPTDPG